MHWHWGAMALGLCSILSAFFITLAFQTRREEHIYPARARRWHRLLKGERSIYIILGAFSLIGVIVAANHT